MRAICLLGAAVRPDGPSPALRRRAEHAAMLWQSDRSQVVLACGGAGNGRVTEAEAAARLLGEGGVPEDAILLESRSRTTWENLLFGRPILQEIGATSLVIVTDPDHLPRARLVAAKLGLTATGSAPSGPRPATARLKGLLREGPALLVYALRPRA
ncbi:YdcF family protein [Histidinibacterium aquaticum]|uniref:YdcF family protein n=1 Tax=Histidinibacterium aquaticum TaxID=2613962 RepID=A0A5J5GC41_9RHOB|nr:YdcF family protein [Histidinibacterium aquaticum]KAA9005739.1 YdcF family protein [Histidinibacterium aquaticum]